MLVHVQGVCILYDSEVKCMLSVWGGEGAYLTDCQLPTADQLSALVAYYHNTADVYSAIKNSSLSLLPTGKLLKLTMPCKELVVCRPAWKIMTLCVCVLLFNVSVKYSWCDITY